MSITYSVLLVEDHALVRAGIATLLGREPGLAIVGEAATAADAIALAVALAPDLVITDLRMPGMSALDAIEEMKRRTPGIKVLVLTLHRAEEYVRGSFEAGADGYILKEATVDELRLAIRSVLGGKTYVSPDISSALIGDKRRAGRGAQQYSSAWESVSLREREVLKLVAEGHSNRSIADHLRLSVKTVEKHRSNLMNKLNLHNASSLTTLAIEKGLLAVGAFTTHPGGLVTRVNHEPAQGPVTPV